MSLDIHNSELFALAELALPLWGLVDARIELIKIRENAVYKVTTPEQKFALRVHRADYHTDAALRSEYKWMQALDESGIHTPAIIPAVDGELFKRISTPQLPAGRQIDLLEWVDAPALGSIEDGFNNDDEIAASFSTIGALAAKLHNHVEHWQLPTGFVRSSFDLDGLTGEFPRWGRFWDCELLGAEGRTVAQAARERLHQDLHSFGNSKDRFGLIHADLLPENLLMASNGIRLIDFDDCGFGWHMFDLATTLFFHLGESYFDAALAALTKGYRAHRTLSDAHLALLPMFLAARGTTYLGWMHTRPESEEAKTMGSDIAAGVLDLMENYLQSKPLEREA